MSDRLPRGWAPTKLGELFEFKYGKGLPKEKRSGGGINVYGSNGVIGSHNVAFTKGVTIIIGRKGSVGEIHFSEAPCWPIDTTYFIDDFRDGLNPRFWKHYLKSLQLGEQEQSSAIPGISRDEVYGTAVCIPPSNEQTRIIAKLEKILAKVNACHKRLERIPVLLKRFRQSVLAAACSGRLTEDWRKQHATNAVHSLLAKVDLLRASCVATANRRHKGKTFRFKAAGRIDLAHKTKGVEELFNLPDSWSWASLGEVTWFIADGPHFSPKYVTATDGIPFISARNVSYGGIDFADAKYISREDYEEFSKRVVPELGDVLLTKGGTTGVATVVSTSSKFTVWVHVAVLKVVPELVDPHFLRDVLTAPSTYKQSQAQTHGVGNQDLGLTRMVHIALPLPPLEEQSEIVRRVKQLFSFADEIEARYTKAKAYVDKLTQSVLAKAFRGELVPQDPNDEPASVLLQKISR